MHHLPRQQQHLHHLPQQHHQLVLLRAENVIQKMRILAVVKSNNTLLSKPENNYASQAKRNDIA
jgi:hypothetical protein